MDPVLRDLKENLKQREEENNRKYELEERWADLRENIEDQLQEISDILNPFYKMDYKSKLDTFALRLEEIVESVRELAKEFE